MNVVDNATYKGQKPNQGIIIPLEPHGSEGFAVLSCGGTQVMLSYTALHLLSGWIACGSAGYDEVRTSGAIKGAIDAICCEASAGGRRKIMMLTNEQINAAIAKQREMAIDPDGTMTAARVAFWGDARPAVPNYCRDWAAAGPLLEDMEAADTEAIARAYHAAFCEEERWNSAT